MGLLDKDSGHDPRQDYQNAINQMNQMYGQSRGDFAPYLAAGSSALPQYQQAYAQMLDPKAFFEKMMSGYTESPEAKLRQELGEQAGQRAAAASGMLGSGAFSKEIADFTQKNIAADQQNWLNNLLKIFGGGMAGASDVAHMGEQGAGELGQIGVGYGSNIAKLFSDMGQEDWAQKQQNRNDLAGILGLGGSILSSIPKFL